MSTKNDKYSFIEQSFTTSENQYYNLNLNPNEERATLIPVQFNSKSNNDKYNVSDDYEEKGKLQSWNKSSKASTFTTLNEDNNDMQKRWKNKNILNITNKSTLSLHIAAYENSNEAVTSDLFDNKNIQGLKEEKLGSIKTSENFFTDRLMNPFEFPRQQNENQRNEPDNMPFKTSQRLLGSQPPSTSQQIGNDDEQMPPGDGTAENLLSSLPFTANKKMTSRRYSELSSASNMSLIDEMDENTTPTVDVNHTPRAKIVPSKRTRVSESPLTSHQQNFLFKGDKNLEETFVEQPSVLASPLSVKSELQNGSAFSDKNLEETFVEQPSVLASPLTIKSELRNGSAFGDKNLEETYVKQSSFNTPSAPITHQTPKEENTGKNVSFKADYHLEETFVEQSFFTTPTQTPSAADITHKSVSFKADNHLEETYVEQSFFTTPTQASTDLQTPKAVIAQKNVSFKADDDLEGTFNESCLVSTADQQTPDAPQRNISFKVDKHLEETDMEEPSIFTTPKNIKSALKTPATDNTQKSVSFDKSFDETIIKPSFFATPKPPTKKLLHELQDDTEDENSFTAEEYFKQTTTSDVTSSEEIITNFSEEQTITPTSSEPVVSPLKRYEGDASFLGGSMVSFLEEEMQVYAEEKCKCVRFESIIKEYTILREKFDKVPQSSTSANTTFKTNDENAEDEMFRMQEELVNVKIEVENYKKAADIAKKEADDFQFVLDEEKRRAKNRIADLQKENFALSDELEALKVGNGGGGDAVGIQQNVNELQDELAQLNNQFTKANKEIDEYKIKLESVQKEADTLQIALNFEKESMNAQLAALQSQKDSEIESLKAAIADSVPMKDELRKLKEKLQIFDVVVKQGYEVEQMCKQLKANIVFLENEKATKIAELDQLTDEFQKQKNDIVEFNDRLLKANSEIVQYKSNFETAQKELEAYRISMDSQIAELKMQNDIEIDQLKNSMNNDKTRLQDELAQLKDQFTKANNDIDDYKVRFESAQKEADTLQVALNQQKESMSAQLAELKAQKDIEIDQLKNSMNNEKTRLQDELAQLKDQFTKANKEIDEYKIKLESAQKEADTLHVALNLEKESMNAQLAELQSQKDSEIGSLRAEIAELEEKLRSFDAVVKQFFEVEETCKQLKAEIVVLEKEKATKTAKFHQFKDEFEKQKADVVGLNDRLLKANGEIAQHKNNFETAQKELDAYRRSLDSQIAESKMQKDIEIDQLKNSMNTEKTKLQDEIAQLNTQLTKANVDKENLNKKVDRLFDDLDAADNERKELSETIFELQSKLAKYGESGDGIRSVINMAEVVSPNIHAASPDTSFKSVTEEPQPTSSSSNSLKGDAENDITPSKSKGTPKRKQSFGAKIASPFRRTKKDQPQSNVSKKEENPNTTCTTQ